MLFFFNDTATTEIYTLSLHDALPIYVRRADEARRPGRRGGAQPLRQPGAGRRHPAERASLGSAGLRAVGGHLRSEEHTSELQSRNISYAVFCLKKKQIQWQLTHSFSI